MGKLQLFEIYLSNSRVIYSPGEPLTGTVNLRLGAALPYRGTLSPGEHAFPFQFLLPTTAPTSFEGPFGKIVHQLRAVIDTPRFSKDHKCSRIFYILSPLNLNSLPDIEVWPWEQPNEATTTKKFSYKLVKSGSVILTASTDLRGYVVGQVVQLRADIENQSGKDTGPVVASLLQKVSYKAKRWIYDLRTIAEVEGSGVKAWKRAEWREQILVPALPQSVLPGCSLIHIDYFIQVSLKAPEATVNLPLFIGNIAVNCPPLSPGLSLSGLPPPLVPTAPPEDLDMAACGPCPMVSVSLPTKSHSQQQQQSTRPFSYTPGLSFPETRPEAEPGPDDDSPAPTRPPLCLSTGATVPYFAEGPVVPMPTASDLILPPEYSSWGYPYAEAPPSYEQSCSSASSGLSNGN
ncbi:arrestin domain-containing protein 1 isoform X3 [Petaurus breviceps papuanus]|uniref:arrestin domain-containing protein 1 isoform X3 n=1 Tax=Petaurus breviceps papuanus TaxID=3040969 RepID=UPI0036D8D2B3